VRYVVDASVALRWYIEDEANTVAAAVRRKIVEQPAEFAVPELFAYEVFSVLFRIHPRPWKTYEEGILPILRCGMLRYPMTEAVAGRAVRFVESGLTGYDAVYAALAEELGAVWLTFDAKAHARIEKEGLSAHLGAGLPPGWGG
jgi:predicted nucleic acid-binding protein